MSKKYRVSRIAKELDITIEEIKSILLEKGKSVPGKNYCLTSEEYTVLMQELNLNTAIEEPQKQQEKNIVEEQGQSYENVEQDVNVIINVDIVFYRPCFFLKCNVFTCFIYCNFSLPYYIKECYRPEESAVLLERGKVTDTEFLASVAQKINLLKNEVKHNSNTLLTESLSHAITVTTSMVPGEKVKSINSIRDYFLFDVINNRYFSSSNENGIIDFNKEMPIYAYMTENNLKRCHGKGFYNNEQLTCFNAFASGNDDIITKSIGDSIEELPFSRDCIDNYGRVMCIMPDSVGMFDKNIQKQLKYNGHQIFPIPKSIMVAYTMEAWQEWDMLDYGFIVLDFDGLDVYGIKIQVEYHDQKPLFIRSGRVKIDASKFLNYISIANRYLKRYAQLHNIEIADEIKDRLISTKQILKVIYDKEKILVGDKRHYFWIESDQRIINELANSIIIDRDKIADSLGSGCYIACSLTDHSEFFTFEKFVNSGGYDLFLDRYQSGISPWIEELPILKLEVVTDGVFSKIQLISNEDRFQEVNCAAFIEEEVELPVIDGHISLNVNDSGVYKLPLIRELYGIKEKPLDAVFKLKEPLSKPREVNLYVRYKYGDEQSLKLVAKPIEEDAEFDVVVSSWDVVDVLSNPVPEYASRAIRHKLSAKNSEKIYKGLRNFHSDARNPMFYQSPVRDIVEISSSNQNTEEVARLCKPLLPRGFISCFDLQNFFSYEYYDEKFINELLESSIFQDFYDIVTRKLDFAVDKSVMDKVIENVLDITSNFGVLYNYEDEKLFNYVDAIRRLNQVKHFKFWINATRELPLNSDRYKIWNTLVSNVKSILTYNVSWKFKLFRTLSAVAWSSKDWIRDFYEAAGKMSIFNKMVDGIIEVIQDEYKKVQTQPRTYNTKRLRDVLELLLALCRIREFEPDFLDSNSEMVKQLVVLLKDINLSMYKLGLQSEFNSRLAINKPEAFYNTNSVIYCLVETLTGGEKITLLDFDENR